MRAREQNFFGSFFKKQPLASLVTSQNLRRLVLAVACRPLHFTREPKWARLRMFSGRNLTFGVTRGRWASARSIGLKWSKIARWSRSASVPMQFCTGSCRKAAGPAIPTMCRCANEATSGTSASQREPSTPTKNRVSSPAWVGVPVKPSPQGASTSAGHPAANRTLRCRLVANGAGRTQTHLGDLPPVDMHEALGTGEPSDGLKSSTLLLATLGSCLLERIRANAMIGNIDVQSLVLEVEAELAISPLWTIRTSSQSRSASSRSRLRSIWTRTRRKPRCRRSSSTP